MLFEHSNFWDNWVVVMFMELLHLRLAFSELARPRAAWIEERRRD